MKAASPKKIGTLIESYLSNRGYLTLCRESQIKLKWEDIVGEKIAAISECSRVENGIVYVRVRAAAWRQEISFYKKQIMANIRAHTDCDTVTDIVFC